MEVTNYAKPADGTCIPFIIIIVGDPADLIHRFPNLLMNPNESSTYSTKYESPFTYYNVSSKYYLKTGCMKAMSFYYSVLTSTISTITYLVLHNLNVAILA